MTASLVISVVLSTFNRGKLLADAIRSLLALDPASPPHEIIIVDNNSTDHTRELVESMIPTSGGRLRYLFEQQQGVSYGRNAGVAACRGSIVAFTDDDVRVSPQWLICIADAFQANERVKYLGGRVLPLWPSPPPAWYSHNEHSAPLALCDYGDEGRLITPEYFVCVVSANLAVRREVLLELGGFDPRFQHQPGALSATEDHELQLRLQSAGYRGLYEPKAVIHAEVQPSRLTKRYHVKWHFDHGRAMVRMSRPGYRLNGSQHTPMAASTRYVAGVPARMLRELLYFAREGAKRAFARDSVGSFRSIGELLEVIGGIQYFLKVRAPGLDATLHDDRPPRIQPPGAP